MSREQVIVFLVMLVILILTLVLPIPFITTRDILFLILGFIIGELVKLV